MRSYNASRSKILRSIKEKLTEQPVIPDAKVLLEISEAPRQGTSEEDEDAKQIWILCHHIY